jgi:hypothetical protein
VARIDDLLTTALKTLPAKPPDSASRETKRAYSEKMSANLAVALGDELREGTVQLRDLRAGTQHPVPPTA